MSDADIMAAAIEKVVDEKIAKAVRDGTQTVTAKYMGADSEGKAWVMLPGASSATPVRRSSVEASVGDTVSVTVGNGMATLDANITDKSAGVAGVAKVDAKATVAQETAAEAIDYATQASAAASSAQSSAVVAQASADSAVADAARANEAATQAISDAADAADAADSAQDSANKATYALSDVEKVVGTVNWIAEHGEYLPTDDTAVDASKVYYTRSGSGTQADPYTYSVVANPVDSELSTYFELNVDESIQNFINAHVYLLTDGLYVTMDDDTHRVRIDSDSVDILDEDGTVVASFGVDGGRVGPSNNYRTEFNEYGMSVAGSESIFEVSSAKMSVDTHSQWEYSRLKHSIRLDGSGIEKGYIFELPSGIKAKSDIANFEWADGYTGIGTAGNNALQEDSTSIWYTKDYPVTAQSNFTSNPSTSTPNDITGLYLHDLYGLVSQYFPKGDPRLSMNAFRTVYEYTYTDKPHMRFGEGTLSSSDNQAVFGRYNVSDTNGDYAVIVGNGTADNARSNALAVKWNGDVACGAVNGCGTFQSDTDSSVSVSNSTNVNILHLALAKGVWMVTGRVQYPSNSTGRRAVKLSTSSQESGNVASTLVQAAVSGATTQMSTSRCFVLSQQANVYLVGWQNSGSTLMCEGDMEAVKLG